MNDSLLIPLTYCWASVCFASAGQQFFVFLLRPSDREFKLFAAFSVMSGISLLLSAKMQEATSVLASTELQRWLYVVLFSELVVGIELIEQVDPIKWLWSKRWFQSVPLLGAFTAFSGLLYDPDRPWAHYNGTLAAHTFGKMHALGIVLMAASLVVVGSISIRFVIRERSGSNRLAAAFFMVPTIGGAIDLVSRATGLPMLHAYVHLTLVAIVGMSYVVLDRLCRVEEQFFLRTKQLAESYAELSRAEEALVRREQLAAVGELSAMIAHEVRSPLSVVRTAVSALTKKQNVDVERRLLSIVDEETDRLDRLIGDLLTYARPIVSDFVRIDAREVVEQALQVAVPDEERRRLVQLSLDDSALDLRGDPNLLRQVVINLISNALQAMSPTGTLSISVASILVRDDPWAVFEVTDTGHGIPPQYLEAVRTPFFTTRGDGTGLGLAIVEKIVRAHHGHLIIRSAEGAGTTVRIELPQSTSRASLT